MAQSAYRAWVLPEIPDSGGCFLANIRPGDEDALVQELPPEQAARILAAMRSAIEEVARTGVEHCAHCGEQQPLLDAGDIGAIVVYDFDGPPRVTVPLPFCWYCAKTDSSLVANSYVAAEHWLGTSLRDPEGYSNFGRQ